MRGGLCSEVCARLPPTTPARAALACLVLLPGIAGAWPSWAPGEGPKGGFQRAAASECEDLSGEPITYGMSYDVASSGLPGAPIDIHDIWLAGGCVGCHNNTAMGGLRLDVPHIGYGNLLGQASFRDPNTIRVIVSDPDESLLHQMLSCTPPVSYPPMPPTASGTAGRIAIGLRAMVYDWIEQGARGVNEDGFQLSDVVFRDRVESQRFQRYLAPTP